MNDSDTDFDPWARHAYEPGGSDALVFYVLFAGADVAPSLEVSAERHRTRGLPEGVHLLLRSRDDDTWTSADFAAHAADAAYAAAARADLQFVLAGSVIDPLSLDYLRDVIGVATALLEAGASAVFDIQTLRLFTAEEFIREVFAPDAPERDAHIAFLRSDDDAREGRSWFHTRGMRKFGRPDISIRNVPDEFAEQAALLLHRFAELGIRGARIPEGQRVVKDGFPEGYTCHHAGSLDDPEFNNVHLELRAPRAS